MDLVDPRTPTLLPASRRDCIVAELARRDVVRNDDLARRFDVSAETIRRDLLLLESHGLVRRIFGGAARATARATEPSFEERRVANLPRKQAMARLAASLVAPGDTLAFDIGTSVAEVARALPLDFTGRALTNSLLVANELAARPGVEVLVSGGRLRTGDLALSGPEATSFFDRYFATRAFLGSGGVDAGAGLTDFYPDEIAVRQVLLRQAAQRYVLADSSKIGQVAVGRVCPLSELTAVITDHQADAQAVRAIEQAGVTVLVAEPADRLRAGGETSTPAKAPLAVVAHPGRNGRHGH